MAPGQPPQMMQNAPQQMQGQMRVSRRQLAQRGTPSQCSRTAKARQSARILQVDKKTKSLDPDQGTRKCRVQVKVLEKRVKDLKEQLETTEARAGLDAAEQKILVDCATATGERLRKAFSSSEARLKATIVSGEKEIKLLNWKLDEQCDVAFQQKLSLQADKQRMNDEFRVELQEAENVRLQELQEAENV